MKCVDTFATSGKAQEVRGFLKSKGIDARVTVDPMDGIYPAHSEYHHGAVAVVVAEKDWAKARSLVQPTPARKAS